MNVRNAILLLALLPNLAWSACEENPVEEFRKIVDASWEALETEDLFQYGQTYKRLQDQLACWREPITTAEWARFLVARALYEFVQGEGWEAPLETALRLEPSSRPSFGPSAIQEFTLPERPEVRALNIPADVEVYVNGQRVTVIPETLFGLHLIQRKSLDKWEYRLIRDGLVPEDWFPRPVEENISPVMKWFRGAGDDHSVSIVMNGGLNQFSQQYSGQSVVNSEISGVRVPRFSSFDGGDGSLESRLPIGGRLWGMHSLPSDFRLSWELRGDVSNRLGLSTGYSVGGLTLLAGASAVFPIVWEPFIDAGPKTDGQLTSGNNNFSILAEFWNPMAVACATGGLVFDAPISPKGYLELEGQTSLSSALIGFFVRSSYLHSIKGDLLFETALQWNSENAFFINAPPGSSTSEEIVSRGTSIGASVGLRFGVVSERFRVDGPIEAPLATPTDDSEATPRTVTPDERPEDQQPAPELEQSKSEADAGGETEATPEPEDAAEESADVGGSNSVPPADAPNESQPDTPSTDEPAEPSPVDEQPPPQNNEPSESE